MNDEIKLQDFLNKKVRKMKKNLFLVMMATAMLWVGGLSISNVNVASVGMVAAAADTTEVSAHGEAAEAGGHGAEAEKPGLLSLTLGEYSWEIILFLVLFAVLAKFVWPPILKGLQEREEKIRGDLSSAENAAKEATDKLDEYKQQLAEAQKKALEIIEEGRVSAQKLAAEVKGQAENEIAGLRERAANEIKGAKEEALAEIYEQAAVMSTQVAGQILRKEIKPEDQRGLIEDSLKALRDRN